MAWKLLCAAFSLLSFWLWLALRAKTRETDYLYSKLNACEGKNREYRDKELVEDIRKKHRIDRRIQVWDE